MASANPNAPPNPTMAAAATANAAPSSSQSPEPDAPYSVALLFDQENGFPVQPPKVHPLTVTSALARVLVRAASLSPTSEPPLQFSTLLIAMLVDEDEWLKKHFQAQQVKFDAISRKRPYYEQSLRSLTESQLGQDYLTSVSARAAFEEAERIARDTSESVLDTRHIAAAYPVLPNWHLQDFAAFEIDRLEWARALGAEMARRFPQERVYWGRYADRASPVPLTSFSADVYTEDDLLGIDRSVDALALLMASTRTVTPLAIGVFGPWGSGKTFFMRHLQKRIVGLRRDEQERIDAWIQKRAARSATPEDSPLYFNEVAQVEFNAWHYNEGNLVASLVEHLFRNLRVSPAEGDEELANRRVQMLGKLKVLNSDLATVDQTIAVAQKTVEEAKAEVARASTNAEAARNEIRESAREIEDHNAALKIELAKLDETLMATEPKRQDIDPEAVITVALGPLAPLAAQVRKTLVDSREQIFDWREFFAHVISAKGLVVVALCVTAPLVLTLAHVLQAQWSAFMGSLAAALAGFGSVYDVLKRHRQQFEVKLAELEAEQQRRVDDAKRQIKQQQEALSTRAKQEIAALSGTIEAQRRVLAEREADMSRAAQHLAKRAQDHEAHLAERIDAEQKVRAAEAELERLSSALLLEEFIKDRASTDEYRKQLGFLALVRRDIERLSKLIDQANKRWLDAGNADGQPPLNRIVLYIDDLDRCKESTVLAVLEAVHLLLAFPLFVCAVAVDPRWVEKCLRQAHQQLFIEEDKPNGQDWPDAPATVGDYLEKIFQIPIWMSPIESHTRATLVNALLGSTAAPPAPRTARPEGDALVAEQTANAAEQGAFSVLVAKAKERPDPLQILPEEAGFVNEIAALLSDRPRALKRFVNIYRLLKASLPDIERATFVTQAPSSPHRICLIQLAFFTSRPRLAAQLVAALESPREGASERSNTGSPATLGEWLREPGQPKAEFRAVLEAIQASNAIPLQDFKYWLPLTSRYLFHRAD